MENQVENVDIEIEVEEQDEPRAVVEDCRDSKDDQFTKAETFTQKAIDRLTKKMREAERREQEAITLRSSGSNRSSQVKARMSTLDTNYVSELVTV